MTEHSTDDVDARRSFLREWFSYQGRMKRWAFLWRYTLASLVCNSAFILINKNLYLGRDALAAGWSGAGIFFCEALLFIFLTAPLCTKRLRDGGFGVLLYWVTVFLAIATVTARGFEYAYSACALYYKAEYGPRQTAASIAAATQLSFFIPAAILTIRLFWSSAPHLDTYAAPHRPKSKRPQRGKRLSVIPLCAFYGGLTFIAFVLLHVLYIGEDTRGHDWVRSFLAALLFIGIGKWFSPLCRSVFVKATQAYRQENPGNSIAYMFIWLVMSLLWAIVAMFPIWDFGSTWRYSAIDATAWSTPGIACAFVICVLVQLCFEAWSIFSKKSVKNSDAEEQEAEEHDTEAQAQETSSTMAIPASTSFWSGWFSYAGRLNRWGFWIRFIITWLILELSFAQIRSLCFSIIANETTFTCFFYLQSLAYTIVGIVAYAPLYIRRYHDVGLRSRVLWFYILFEVAIRIALHCPLSQEIKIWLAEADVVVGIGMLVLATRPSQRGDNKYGAQPKPWDRKWYQMAGLGILLLLSGVVLCRLSWTLTRDVLQKVGGEDLADYVGEMTHLEQKPKICLVPGFVHAPTAAQLTAGEGIAAAILRDKGLRYRELAKAEEFAELSVDDPERLGACFRKAFGDEQTDLLTTLFEQLPKPLQSDWAEQYRKESIERWSRGGDVLSASDAFLGKLLISLARYQYDFPYWSIPYMFRPISLPSEKDLEKALRSRGKQAEQEWDTLILRGINLNAEINDGAIRTTPLLHAVSCANLALIKRMQEKGATFDLATKDVPSPWHALLLRYRGNAYSTGTIPIALYLLEQGIHPDVKIDVTDVVRLYKDAMLEYRQETLEQMTLLDVGDLSEVVQSEQDILDKELSQRIYITPLHHYAGEGVGQVVRALLDKNATQINTGYNGTPLHMAVRRPGNEEIIYLLLEKGASVNELSSHGITPLMSAIFADCSKNARLLIREGADVNAGTNATPLHFACARKNAEMVRYLLSHGAKITRNDPKNDRAGTLRAAILSKDPQIVRLILAAGGSLDDQDANGVSDGAVLYALSESNPPLRSILPYYQEIKYKEEVTRYINNRLLR